MYQYENHKNQKGLQRKLEVLYPKRTLLSLVIRHLIIYFLFKTKTNYAKKFTVPCWFANFFGKAIRSARAFNRRFYDLTMKAKKPHHFIKLNAETKADMHMWLYFLESFNGKTYFPECSWTDSDVLELFTNSAGSVAMGCGAYFSGQWVHFSWPET